MPVSNARIGTTHSGYSGPDHAPFACHACVHYEWPHACSHPDVIKDAKDGELKMQKNGFAVVAPGGCCTYFRDIKN